MNGRDSADLPDRPLWRSDSWDGATAASQRYLTIEDAYVRHLITSWPRFTVWAATTCLISAF